MFTSVVRLIGMKRILFVGLLTAASFFAPAIASAAPAPVPVSANVSGSASCADGGWQVAWTASSSADQWSLDAFAPGSGPWRAGVHSGSVSTTGSYPLSQGSVIMAISVFAADGSGPVAMDNLNVNQPQGCDVVAVAPAASAMAPVASVAVAPATTIPPAVIIPGVNDGTQVKYGTPTWVNPVAVIVAETAPVPVAVAERLPAVTSPADPAPVVAPVVGPATPVETFPPSFVGWPAVTVAPPW